MKLEWAKLAVALVSHVAWPIAILVAVWLLKGRLLKLLDPKNVEQIEAGLSGVKLTTRKIDFELDSVRQAVSTSAPSASPTDTLEESPLKSFAEIAAIDPAAAALASAARFESVLRRRMDKAYREAPQSPEDRRRLQPMGRMIKEAQETGLLSSEEASAAERLNQMRNQIVHQYADVEMSELQAIEFCRLSAGLERAILD